MREPSTEMRLLTWHRAFMRGLNPPRHEDVAEVGWYKMKQVKGGPWVAVEIRCVSDVDEHGELTDDEYLIARVNGIDKDPLDVWTYLKPISRKEFLELQGKPLRDHRFADPTKPIDLSLAPTLPEG